MKIIEKKGLRFTIADLTTEESFFLEDVGYRRVSSGKTEVWGINSNRFHKSEPILHFFRKDRITTELRFMLEAAGYTVMDEEAPIHGYINRNPLKIAVASAYSDAGIEVTEDQISTAADILKKIEGRYPNDVGVACGLAMGNVSYIPDDFKAANAVEAEYIAKLFSDAEKTAGYYDLLENTLTDVVMDFAKASLTDVDTESFEDDIFEIIKPVEEKIIEWLEEHGAIFPVCHGNF